MSTISDPDRYDVLIVGAGPAGLSAALVLGRMRRRTLVLDTGAPAHAVSEAVHGFLAQDGTSPPVLRRTGREQLAPYDTVEVRDIAAAGARRCDDGTFALQLGDGVRAAGRHLLLAHGMHYGLPDVAGLAPLWGSRVFHCPYCHGWEVRGRRLAVIDSGERAAHQAELLSSLSDDVEVVRDSDIERVDEQDGEVRLILPDDTALTRDALFIQPALALASDLAVTLGADLTEAGAVAVDPAGQSSIEGLYAAGDAATAVQSVAVAAGSGARAAYAINASLAGGAPR
jgi:thioredoxin reductase